LLRLGIEIRRGMKRRELLLQCPLSSIALLHLCSPLSALSSICALLYRSPLSALASICARLYLCSPLSLSSIALLYRSPLSLSSIALLYRSPLSLSSNSAQYSPLSCPRRPSVLLQHVSFSFLRLGSCLRQISCPAVPPTARVPAPGPGPASDSTRR
jgi:hypothetical protein